MIDPRVVLYTADMEPITVLELPVSTWNYLECYGRVSVAVKEPAINLLSSENWSSPNNRIVNIWVEKFVREGRTHLMLFTHDDENALLLQSAFLPGQQRGMQEELNSAFAQGFLEAIRRVGM